jgi:glutamate 5-kinase
MMAKNSTKRTRTPKAKRPQEGLTYHRVVVKLGSNLLTAGTERLDLEIMSSLVGQVARLHDQGVEVVLVSSGAMAAGRDRLGITRERKNIPFRQVLASVGQGRLMNAYEQLFAWHGITVAQALLTKADLSDRTGYLNARNTILALLELRVIPIVNENDVVAIDEIKEAKFGDNDNLSAMVANLADADLLIMLGDIPGLCTADPCVDPKAQVIPTVDRIDTRIERLAKRAKSQRGTGGMATKIEAAKLATGSGISVVIADGQTPNVIPRIVQGESVGTHFSATTSKRESRERWMLSGLGIRGKIIIDEGAASALRQEKGSLLPAGIKAVEKKFNRGEIVDIVDSKDDCIARGISNYSSHELEIIKGARSTKIMSLLGYEYGAEVVHRNNLVLL